MESKRIEVHIHTFGFLPDASVPSLNAIPPPIPIQIFLQIKLMKNDQKKNGI